MKRIIIVLITLLLQKISFSQNNWLKVRSSETGANSYQLKKMNSQLFSAETNDGYYVTGSSNGLYNWNDISTFPDNVWGHTILGYDTTSGGHYYIATGAGELGAYLYNSTDGVAWTQVSNEGFDYTTEGFTAMATFRSVTDTTTFVYIAKTGNSGAEVWRAPYDNTDPNVWQKVFDFDTINVSNTQINQIIVFQNKLYFCTNNYGDIYSSVDGLVWDKDMVAADGFNNFNSYGFEDLEVYNGNLYLAISNSFDGAELRKFDGANWTIVFTGGNGSVSNAYIPDIHAAEDALWISMHNENLQAKSGNNQQQAANLTSTILTYTDGIGVITNYYAEDGEADYYGQFCCLDDLNGYIYALGTKNWSYANIVRLCVTGVDAVDLMNDTTVCAGTPVTFDAGNLGATYLWEDLSTTTPTFTSTLDGLYTCYVTSPTGCERPVTANKYSNPLPPQAIVTPSTNEVVCKGNSISLTALDAEIYRDGFKSDGYITNFVAPLNYSNVIDESITIEFWVKPNGAGVLLSEVDQSLGWYDSWIEVESNGNLWGRTWGTAGSSTIGTLNMGQWNHLAMSYDKLGGGDLRFFINGIESPSIQVYDREAPYESGFYNVNFNFGDGNNTYMYQNNAIDAIYSDIRIWNTPRNQAEIAMCMDSVFASATPGLINYYRFLEHSGTMVADSSGFGNNGYLEEGAAWFYNPNYIINWAAHNDIADPSLASITVTPDTTTIYTAHMVDANGCASSTEVNITVPEIIITPATPAICIGDTVVLNSGISIDGGLWNSSHAFNQISIQDAEVFPITSGYFSYGGMSQGCNLLDSVFVTVNALPIVSAGADIDTCENYQVQLNASGAVAYSWSPDVFLNQGDIANPLLSAYTGSIIVVGTDANACVNSDTINVNAKPTPNVMVFDPNDACLGSNFVLNSNIALSQGSVISYTWNFGDGNGNNLENTTYTYPNAGTYTVSLYAKSDLGCEGSAAIFINVYEPPTADYTVTSACENGTTDFINLSTSNNTITFTNWDFGDGNIGANFNGQNVYSAAGNYTSSLVVFDENNCTDTAFVSVTVNASPIIDFTYSAPCEERTINFYPTSNTSLSNYDWEYNYLDNSYDSIGVYEFAAIGNYTVELSAIDINGCYGFASKSFDVNVNPAANYTVANACLGEASTFVDASTISQGTIAQYAWDFGDGQSNNVTNPIHTYLYSGTYSASLIATSDVGCSDTAFVSPVVHDLPVVSAGADLTVCPGSSFELTPSTGYSSYNWSPTIGLSNPITENPICSPATNITYTVYATDANGCMNSDTIYIIIDTDVVDASNGITICYGETTQLNATGVLIYNWTPSTYLSSSTVSNPYSSPTTHTTYTVQGTTLNGCVSYDTVSVWVKSLPTISGLVQYDSLGTLVPLTNGTVQVYYADSLGNIVPAASANVTNGAFNFGSVPIGTITLLSIPDSNQYYPNLGMQYLGGYQTWNNVGTVTLTCDENNYQTITHPYYVSNLGGDGFISGYVVEGVAPRKPGEPVRGAGVALEQIPGGSVAYRTTDTLGYFDFPNVPTGNYQLLVNIPGKDLAETYNITITAGNYDKDTANVFFVNDTLIYISDSILTIDSVLIKVQSTMLNSFDIKLMPNPAKDIAYVIVNMAQTGVAVIEITSITGQLQGAVIKTELSEGKHSFVIDRNKNNLPNGVYFITVRTNSESRTERLILD